LQKVAPLNQLPLTCNIAEMTSVPKTCTTSIASRCKTLSNCIHYIPDIVSTCRSINPTIHQSIHNIDITTELRNHFAIYPPKTPKDPKKYDPRHFEYVFHNLTKTITATVVYHQEGMIPYQIQLTTEFDLLKHVVHDHTFNVRKFTIDTYPTTTTISDGIIRHHVSAFVDSLYLSNTLSCKACEDFEKRCFITQTAMIAIREKVIAAVTAEQKQ
jgi:hypothetical protein